jgi:hypothetical protein
MASEKSLYWIALVLVALSLNSSMAKHGAALASYARSAISRVSGAAETYVAVAENALRRPEGVAIPEVRVEPRLAQAETTLNCRRTAQMARLEARMARLQAERSRMMVLEQRPDVEVYALPQVHVDVPNITVDGPRLPRPAPSTDDGTI